MRVRSLLRLLVHLKNFKVQDLSRSPSHPSTTPSPPHLSHQTHLYSYQTSLLHHLPDPGIYLALKSVHLLPSGAPTETFGQLCLRRVRRERRGRPACSASLRQSPRTMKVGLGWGVLLLPRLLDGAA